ncbi:MAG TPA: type IV pilus modification protein PilV [Thiobacillus sp.]|nr:type IV pilus modification protein PilV [Thiobacillus sp.]
MKQSGFTLLEVLVAMLVLSIGLLGLAGLMASSMRNNLSASHRTQATWMAYDIIDRMRANRAGALAGSYATAMGTAAACATAVPTGTVPVQDIAAWKNQLACALPAGNGSIAVNAGTRAATIMIQWNDSRGSQGSANETFTVDTQL